MSGILTVALIVLIFVIIFQIAKASEYVSVLKGEKKAREDSNRINAFLMIGFLILGFIGIYVCNQYLAPKLLPESASLQGVAIDHMITVTLIITGIVFVVTQVLLFYFAFRYQATDKRKAYFYSHNNKLELIWTVIPALVMTILVGVGLKHWFELTSPAPRDAMEVEVTGKQFNWIFRYPGKDGVLGKRNYKLIDDANSNPLGQDWSDRANRDDIVETSDLHLVVNKPVNLIIGSRDVVHDVGMPYFRLKMDAVPGIPTSLWLTPTITTKQMAEKVGDPNFTYKLVCDQLCGKGHYSMIANIIVETQGEFDQWIASQKPEYQYAMASLHPAAAPTAVADSIKTPAGAAPGKGMTKTISMK
ncbi:MAG: cytochrome c oxidase subunit II [Chitinophagaceae bacterium]